MKSVAVAFSKAVVAASLSLLTCWSVSAQKQTSDEILLQIDGEPVSRAEFERLYRKNNLNLLDDSLKQMPKDYLELFINYKLKVREAEELGLDTLPDFLREFNNYKEQVAKTYLNYNTLTEDEIRAGYERMTTEIKASHILIEVAPNASQAEADSALQKSLRIRAQLEQGADFKTLARKYSDDPSVVKNGGSLGYFKGFQMVPEFDQAAFALKPGELSQPIRSKFGYHLIQLYDKRPARGEIKVAHIMKRLPAGYSDQQLQSARQLLDSLRSKIVSGEDFAAIAQRYSEDKQTSVNGGELPWFSPANMMPEFANPAYALEYDGAVSAVIQTPYGLHLIKRLSVKPIPPYQELKATVEEKLRNNPVLSEQKKELFTEQLKAEYQFTENEKLKQQVLDELSALSPNSRPTLNDEFANQFLFGFDTLKYTVQDFWSAYEKEQHNYNPPSAYKYFTEDQLIAFEKTQLEEKYPEYKNLVQEYHDGILLFNLSEQKIWNKAASDSVGLQAFYKANPKKFMWDSRFEGWVIKCKKQEVRDYMEDIFEQEPQIDKTEMQELLNLNFVNAAFIQKGIFAPGQNPLVDYRVWNKEKPADFVDGLHFVRGDLTPPSPKTLEEAKGLYITAYQDYLEQEWINELSKKYKVQINKKVLKKIESVK